MSENKQSHWWICFWLYFLVLASCSIDRNIERIAKALEKQQVEKSDVH